MLEAWDEGDPYYIDEAGAKRYAYHPDEERMRCTDVEVLHVCLDCRNEFIVDSAAQVRKCPKCKSSRIPSICSLGGKRCPFCNKGKFTSLPGAIS
jgi:DNA-directed RNA polymerase subunit RPC12/RpoP